MVAFRYEDRGDRPRVRIGEEEVLRGLRAFAKEVGGRRFTVQEFDAWLGRPFSVETVIRRCGSWREGLARIGIEGGRARRYPAAEVVAEFERVWREIGRRPGDWMLKKHGRLSLNVYRNRWGTVRRLGEMVAAFHRGEISREVLLAGDAKLARRKGMRASVRWRVLERDGYRCVACGRSPALERGVELQVDHIAPASRGGGDEIENLRTLCRACNVGRGVGKLNDVLR